MACLSDMAKSDVNSLKISLLAIGAIDVAPQWHTAASRPLRTLWPAGADHRSQDDSLSDEKSCDSIKEIGRRIVTLCYVNPLWLPLNGQGFLVVCRITSLMSW